MKEYQDFYFRKAKKENYPARSIYKLKEIDQKFHILRKGMKGLDLGAAPGSWTLGCAEKFGTGGSVLACDLKMPATSFPANVRFMQEDIFAQSPEFIEALKSAGPFDIALSDMAPATTGSRFTDQARSYELARAAFEIACEYLRPGGSFVVKIFMGPDTGELQKEMRAAFGQVKTFKPKSSRAESKETFLIGLDFKGPSLLPEA